MSRARHSAPAVLAALCALAVAACGGSGHTTTTPPATHTVTSTVTSPPSSTSTSASSTTSIATASAAGAGCVTRQLAIALRSGGAGLSHVAVVLTFRNTAGAACTISGYPGADLVLAPGHDVSAKRTRSGYLGGVSSKTDPSVRLAPGAQASAMLEGLDMDPSHGGAACPKDPALLVTPPNQTVTVRLVGLSLAMCDPEVHPVVPGVSGSSH